MKEKRLKHNSLLIVCCIVTLVAFCATCGIAWATLAFNATSANQSIPPASLSADIYVGTSATSNTLQSASFSVSNGNSIYFLPTTCGASCVMRARSVKTNYTFASTWTLQDNDWYYYNSVIAPNPTTKILFATNSTGSAISGNHVYVEVIQTNGVAENKGFISAWKSLNEDPIVGDNDANTIQVYSNLTSSFDINATGLYFGAYAINSSNQITQLAELSSSNTSTLNTSSTTTIYAPVTSSDNQNYSGTLKLGATYNLSSTYPLRLYNNITSSMIFLVGFNVLLYDSSKNKLNETTSSVTLTSTQTEMPNVANTYVMKVRPGRCESVLTGNTISFTTTELNNSVAYARLIMSVTAIDVDSFQSSVDTALDKTESNRTDAEKRFISVYNALGGSYVSAYMYWLKQLDSTNLTYYNLYTDIASVNE